MKKNQENNFSSDWVKYSNYEFVQINEETYIKPTEDAEYEIYDPFLVADDILVDILNIGRLAINNEFEVCNSKILEFVRNYGLLGELTFLPLNSNIVHQRKTYLPKGNQFTNKEVVPTEEYLKYFLVADKNKRIGIEVAPNKTIVISNSNEATANIILDKGIEYNIVFSKGYSEKLTWFVEYAQNLYIVFDAIENFGKEDNEYERKMSEMYIKSFVASNIACRVEMLKEPTLKWDFNSLKLAINTMFLLNETTQRKTVKICKFCGKAFSSQNLKAEYCSLQCRNKANVYKSREKNKNQ